MRCLTIAAVAGLSAALLLVGPAGAQQGTGIVRAGVPATQPADPNARLVAMVQQGGLVMVATVQEARTVAQTRSMPPTHLMQVTLKDVEMLKGDKPEALTFNYSVREGAGLIPKADQKVLAVLPRFSRLHQVQPPAEIKNDGPAVFVGPAVGAPERILLLVEATEENVKAAKEAIAKLPPPASQPEGVKVLPGGGVGIRVPEELHPVDPIQIPAQPPRFIGPPVQVEPPVAPDPDGGPKVRGGAAVMVRPPIAIAPNIDIEVAPGPVQRVPPVGAPAPAAPVASDRDRIIAACQKAERVMVATVETAQAGIQTMSEPPTVIFSVTLKDVQMLKGDKPESLVFSHAAVRGRGFEPAEGQKVLAAVGKQPAGGFRPMPDGPAIQGRIQGGGGVRLDNPNGLVADGNVVQPMPVRPFGPAAMGPRLLLLVAATDANVAVATKAVGLPVGWSLGDKDALVCPFDSLGAKAWPKDIKFKPKTDMVCSKTGRPALLAGKGVTLTVEQVPPKVKEQYKNPFGDGEFKVTVTNTTDKPVEVAALLGDGKAIFWADCLVIIERERVRLLPGAGSLTADAAPVKLEAGQSVSTVINTLLLKDIAWPRGGSRVNFTFGLGELSADNFFYYFSDYHDKLLGGAGGPADPPTGPGDGKWTNLFASENWYKGQAGKEQEFTGTLEAVPQAGGFSSLQRTSYYKLGERTIYTGAKKLAALDGLVGKKVVIRGKSVAMDLEGQSLLEIWPAAVRQAD